jgi:hypothetical protein
MHAIRNNSSNPGYSNHIPDTGHICGTIMDSMDIIKTGKKGKHLNTLGKYHIYIANKDNLHINHTYIDTTSYLRPYTNFTPDSIIHPLIFS